MNRRVSLLGFLIVLFTAQLCLAQAPEKIYYTKDWKPTTTAANAEYYRIISFDKDGKPTGMVRDYYITGELQWEGRLTYFDRTDDKRNVSDGTCTWYYKSGKKSSEVTFAAGRENGMRRLWNEN